MRRLPRNLPPRTRVIETTVRGDDREGIRKILESASWLERQSAIETSAVKHDRQRENQREAARDREGKFPSDVWNRVEEIDNFCKLARKTERARHILKQLERDGWNATELPSYNQIRQKLPTRKKS